MVKSADHSCGCKSKYLTEILLIILIHFAHKLVNFRLIEVHFGPQDDYLGTRSQADIDGEPSLDDCAGGGNCNKEMLLTISLLLRY